MYDGSEKLLFGSDSLDFSILDFWSWAYSDLIRNVNRGAFAEFLVKSAMEISENTQKKIYPPPEQMYVFQWTLMICSVQTVSALK